MTTIYINNQQVEVPEGSSILEAAQQIGVKIPTLCHLIGHEAQGAGGE